MTTTAKQRIINAINGHRTISIADIARRTGCHRSYVIRVARMLQCRCRRLRPVIDDPHMQANVIALREADLSTRQIARALGVSHTSVHRILIDQIERLSGARGGV